MTTTVTKTIKSSGGNYSSLTAWEADRQRNLVSADEIEVAECYNDFSGGLEDDFALADWTTSATNYVKIYTPTAQRHDGTPGSGFKIWRASPSSGVVRVAIANIVIDGLEIYCSGTGASAYYGTTGQAYHTITNCLIHDKKTGTGYTLQGTSVADVYLTVRNTAIWGSQRTCDTRNASSALFQNCVFWRHADQIGVLGDADTTYTNCYSGKASGSTNDFYTTSSPSGSYNASSDTTATTAFSNSLASKAGSSQFTSVTADSEDFHLLSSSDLIGAGTNLYATFTTDIDGDTWPSSGAWDIGFDYYVSGGTTVTGTGAVTASATVSGIGASIASAAGAVSVSATVSATSQATASATGAASGQATVAGSGAAIFSAVAAAAASATVAAEGATSAGSTAAATGTATVSGAGAATAAGTAAAATAATVAGISAATAAAVASAACAASVAGVGQAQAGNVAEATASATATGVGAATAAGVASAAASTTVSGVGQDGTNVQSGVATASASATVAGTGAAIASATGSISCVASLLGVGGWTYPAAAAASASATVAGVGTDATIVIYGWLCGTPSVAHALDGTPGFAPALTGSVSAYPQGCQ